MLSLLSSVSHLSYDLYTMMVPEMSRAGRIERPLSSCSLSWQKKVKIRYLAFQSFTETAGMPQRVFCEGCGATLYDRPELESPSEIIQRYNGTCPKCQKTLLFEIEKVRILPYDENLMPSKARRKWVFSRQGLAVFPHSKRARELAAALSWTSL